jgi:glycosyltransferase involved in cell wall biosynthesis
LRAFKLASERLTDLPLDLVMAGDGAELPTLKALAEAEQIANVQFTGTVSGAEKKRVLFDSDIFLFPTMHAEGMPNVILEAMLYGLPVITRAAGAISDIVIDGKNGFLLDTTDPAAFAEKLIVIAKDQHLRYRMASENHEKALSNYASDVVRGRVLRIIDSVSAS